MSQEFKQGDEVEWNTPQGKTRGTVKKKHRGSLWGLRSFGYPTRARRPGCKQETDISSVSNGRRAAYILCWGAL